jgi:hypothetical protein
VATWAGGRRAAAFGGYSTRVPAGRWAGASAAHVGWATCGAAWLLTWPPAASTRRWGSADILSYSYYGDAFVYDAPSNCWRCIVSDEGPEHRAGAAMVHVPPAEEGGAAASGAGRLTEGRLLLLGGYMGGRTPHAMPFSDVWELSLSSGIRRVTAVCHGCGKAGAGMKQCAGSCGGAVALCGGAVALAQCQAAV